MRFRLNDSFSGKSWTIDNVQWTPQNLVAWIMELNIGLSDEAKLLLPNGMSLNETVLNSESDVVIYVLDQNLLTFTYDGDKIPSIPSLKGQPISNVLTGIIADSSSDQWKDKISKCLSLLSDILESSSKIHNQLSVCHDEYSTSIVSPEVAMNYLQRRQSGMKDLLFVFYERLDRVSVSDLLHDFLALPTGSLPITPLKILSTNWTKLDSWLNSISARYAEAQKRVQQCIGAANSIIVSPFKEVPSIKEGDDAYYHLRSVAQDAANILQEILKIESTSTTSQIKPKCNYETEITDCMEKLQSNLSELKSSRKSSLISLKSFWLSFYKVSLRYDALYEYLRQIAEELDRSKFVLSQSRNIFSLYIDILMEALRRTEWQESYNVSHDSSLPLDQEKELSLRKSWLSHFSNLLFNHGQLKYLPVLTRDEISNYLLNIQAHPNYQTFHQMLSNRLSEYLGFPGSPREAVSNTVQANNSLHEKLAMYQNRCNNLEAMLSHQNGFNYNINNDGLSPNAPHPPINEQSNSSQPFYRVSPSIVPLNVIRKLTNRKTSFTDSHILRLQDEVNQLRNELDLVNKRNEDLLIELQGKEEKIQYLETENEEVLQKYENLQEELSSTRKLLTKNEAAVAEQQSNEEMHSNEPNILNLYSVFEGKVDSLQELYNAFKLQLTSLKQKGEYATLAKDAEAVQHIIEERDYALAEKADLLKLSENRKEQCKILTQKLYTIVFRCNELQSVLRECVTQPGFDSDNERDGHASIPDRQIEFNSKDLQYLYWMDGEDADRNFQEFLNRMSSLDFDSFHNFVVSVLTQAHNHELRWKREFQSNRDKALKAILDSQSKVSLRNFKQGSLVLFLPTRRTAGNKKVWAAFNVNAPHYYLNTQPHLKLESRDWMLGRVTSIEDRTADDSTDKWLRLPSGTIWHLVEAIDERF
ncbi:hypothetical protein POMI540_2382 [Schizosaccharomyces pombe]|uniref:Taz1-interacting factor 1 n=1 Tax=Schizosaccharomyces pombe (strain 972 / ATCC 24843) TaxID=284812 RepID=ATG11_SCHPO|nr:autophagy-associated protein taf1 [Schizosaccharomyces pombe]O14261.2 RecName: Full=Taz1-interacting factor 1; Short=Protein taf1; AltName: Full=Autophagy-related protein 11; AltName: Full=Cytoplasm to vacuole targeting protein 9 [Schizosaccharomyces pombe 972h-]CAB16721.2 Taz1 interacting factor 1, autophagy protein [Schizosaccharomyces pombe]|eukprot:NP_593855.1 autophagy-associated protein taf1 [Schizosaccharomyces pombe]